MPYKVTYGGVPPYRANVRSVEANWDQSDTQQSPISRRTRRVAGLSDAQTYEVAVNLYTKIANLWGLDTSEAARLLDIPQDAWEHCRRPENERVDCIDQKRIDRISLIVGIHLALHENFGNELANRWAKIHNDDPLFGGATPLDTMITGGEAAISDVRDYLDAASVW